MRCLLFVVLCVLCVVDGRCLLFVRCAVVVCCLRCVLFVVCCLLFVVDRVWFVLVRYLWLAV